MLQVDYYSFTDKGGRANNEDSIGVAEGMYIVADGLGGHSFGEIASGKTVEYVKEHFSKEYGLNNEKLHELICETNSFLWNLKQENKEFENMASTLVIGFANEGIFNYLNVGDSRFYYFRNNKIFKQSRDHSLTQICVDTKEIRPKQMRFHEDRNKLTKVLGIGSNIKINDIFEPFPMKNGDAFLLCSDGFWEYVWEKEMCKCLKKSDSPEDWFLRMKNFFDKRVDGKNDNFSVICGFVFEE